MRDRDAGDGGYCDGRADSRDHGGVDAGVGAGQELLTTAAEDERVPALEPDDVAPLLRVLDQEPVDLVLISGAASR
jgi:hypothetical protein